MVRPPEPHRKETAMYANRYVEDTGVREVNITTTRGREIGGTLLGVLADGYVLDRGDGRAVVVLTSTIETIELIPADK